jgi:rubrerythrin
MIKLKELLAKNPIEIEDSKINDCDILRQAIIAEYDAISLYQQLATKTSIEKIKEVLIDIAKEEKTHVGELEALLIKFDPEHKDELKKGAEEVGELVNEIYHPVVKFGDDEFADPLKSTTYPPIDKLSEPDIQDLINKRFPQIEVYRSTFLKMNGEKAIYSVETYNNKTMKMWIAKLSVYYEDDHLGGQLAASFI